MAFEYDDGSTSIVVLGGVDKKTGRKNPTELVGYYLRKDTIKTKFGEKPMFVFKTKDGVKGLLGSGNLTKIMSTKIIGLQTHVIDTGEKRDVGKGNPMKVFKVGQDATDSLNLSTISELPEEDTYDTGDSELAETDTDEAPTEVVLPAAVAPSTPARTPSPERQAQLKAMMARAKTSRVA